MASFLLPVYNSPNLFLRKGEQILSVTPLPDPVGDNPTCLALATQSRVMIVTKDELCYDKLTCNTLIPIGSHCVAFCSAASSYGCNSTKIQYLSCLERN